MAFLGGSLLLASLYFFSMENLGMPLFTAYCVSLAALVYLVIRLALWQVKIRAPGDAQEGFVASSFSRELIGKEGIASTDLKPSGYILVEGRRFEAISQAGYIDQSMPIEILGGEGSHLIVQPIKKGL